MGDEQSQKSDSSLIDEANKAAERLEKANKEKAVLLEKEEQLMAKRALGGNSSGLIQTEKPKPLTPKEYAKQLSKGVVPQDVK